jgi:replicative DNA helicase
MLSDLRESGSIEQDADVVMFIHREDKSIKEDEWNKANPSQPYPRDRASLIIAKHRNGPTDEVEMRVRDAVGVFEELSFQTQTQAASSFTQQPGVAR